MESIQKYYENTMDALPHPIVEEFVNMNITPQNAIDLGCGAGRDTIYLIKNGWNVLAIDREDTKELISRKLDNEELKRLEFCCENFENVELRKNILFIANFSIPFCDKDYFHVLWREISDSILKERIFCRKLFWNERFLETYKRRDGIFI